MDYERVLDSLLHRVSLPVSAEVLADRLPDGIEATAYFVISEALTNVVKHADASGAQVKALLEPGMLQIEIRDDGIGGAQAGHASGLRGLEDRVAALDGQFLIESPEGGGTRVIARLPIPADDQTRGESRR